MLITLSVRESQWILANKKEMGTGVISVIPFGHDAWVIGKEPCTAIDFSAGKMYGKAYIHNIH
ncbi:hypothetical protein [Legionella parisiensis]|nr:hypothetical protein [Legionella parisiensis]